MRVDWCVSSWFRIKNTHSHTHIAPFIYRSCSPSAPTGSTLLVGSRGGFRPVCVGASSPPPSFAPSVVPPSIHTILEPPSMSPLALPFPDNDLTKVRGDAPSQGQITLPGRKSLGRYDVREDQSVVKVALSPDPIKSVKAPEAPET